MGPRTMCSNGRRCDSRDVAAGGFDQRERCGLEDDRLVDLVVYRIALVVDHVQRELFAVEA